MVFTTKPFPRWGLGDRPHFIYHFPGDLGRLNDSMPTARANMLLYSRPNSIRWMDTLKEEKINSCDNDVIKGPGGRAYVSHWEKPLETWVGYKDSCGHYKRGLSIKLRDMDPEHIPHLEHVYEGYHINSIEAFTRALIKRKRGSCYELKNSFDEEFFARFMSFIQKEGGHPDQFMFMTLPSQMGVYNMQHAGLAGFKTGLLGGHGDALYPAFADVAKVTWVKGSGSAYDHKLRNGMVRIGSGAASCTKQGASVHPKTVLPAHRMCVRKGGKPPGFW